MVRQFPQAAERRLLENVDFRRHVVCNSIIYVVRRPTGVQGSGDAPRVASRGSPPAHPQRGLALDLSSEEALLVASLIVRGVFPAGIGESAFPLFHGHIKIDVEQVDRPASNVIDNFIK